MRGGHHRFAILATIKSLDFPDIRLHAGVLKFLDGLHHQLGTKLKIVGFLVAFEPFHLRLLRRHQEFEHEPAFTFGMQIVGKLFQPRRLPLVQRPFALWIVAHEDLAECRVKSLNVFGEVVAVFKIKFLLHALLGGTRSGKTIC